MLYERETRGTVADVTERAAQAVAAHKFGVLGQHDLRSKMREKGVEFGPACVILEICNPHQAKAVLEQNLSISTALPCRIAIFERGGKIVVSTLRPTVLLTMFGTPGLDPVAQDVEQTIVKIIDATCA